VANWKNALITQQVRGWLVAGWGAYRANWKVLVPGSLILTAFGVAGSLVLTTLPSYGLYLLTVYVWLLFITNLLTVGWAFLCLLAVRGDGPRLPTIFSGFRHFRRAFLVELFYILVVMVGSFLLIIPGIIWAFKYLLATYAVMDKSMYASDAMSYSGRITKGYKLRLLELMLVGTGIGMLLMPAWPIWDLVMPEPKLAMPMCAGSAACAGSAMDLVELIPAGWQMPLDVLGALIYPVSLFVVTPWLAASMAAAYDELQRLTSPEAEAEAETPQPAAPKSAAEILTAARRKQDQGQHS